MRNRLHVLLATYILLALCPVYLLYLGNNLRTVSCTETDMFETVWTVLVRQSVETGCFVVVDIFFTSTLKFIHFRTQSNIHRIKVSRKELIFF